MTIYNYSAFKDSEIYYLANGTQVVARKIFEDAGRFTGKYVVSMFGIPKGISGSLDRRNSDHATCCSYVVDDFGNLVFPEGLYDGIGGVNTDISWRKDCTASLIQEMVANHAAKCVPPSYYKEYV